ncbi:MAG: hypothetical protein AAF191_03250 [Verrucomicrobiota bacterium]
MMDRVEFRWLWPAVCLALLALSPPLAQAADRQVILILGAPGNESYDEAFEAMALAWEKEGFRAPDLATERVRTREELTQTLGKWRGRGMPLEETWIVFLGHGTDDGKTAKLNLLGEDISAEDLGSLLEDWPGPLCFVHTGSASGRFASILGKDQPQRVIITATQDAGEVYVPRWGTYLAEAWGDAQADLDQDQAVSLLEAAIVATKRVGDFYEGERRLATEHAVLEDNGDGKTTRLDRFEGLEFEARKDENPDGEEARRWFLRRSPLDQSLTLPERQRRDVLEAELAALKASREAMTEEDFFQQAEAILLQLGGIYRDREEVDSEGSVSLDPGES